MQPCNRICYSKIYWKLNVFWAAYRSSSGAPNCICSLWFIYECGDRPLSRVGGKCWVPTQPGQWPVTTWVYKPEAANTVWSSRWRAVCRSKHVEPSINFGIINSVTRLHLVGYFYWFADIVSSNVIQTYVSFLHCPNFFTVTTPAGKIFAVVPFVLLLMCECLKQEVLLPVNLSCV